VDEHWILYDDTENTATRYVGYAGGRGRYDLAITTTAQFYGKKLVTLIQTGRTAILSNDEVDDVHYVMKAFQVKEAEAKELSEILSANLV
jgi:SAV0927-like